METQCLFSFLIGPKTLSRRYLKILTCSRARTVSRINSADRRLARPLPVLGHSGAGKSCDVREHVDYSTYSTSTFTLLNARSRAILTARYYERLDYGLPSLGRNYRKIHHSSRFCFPELKMDDVPLKPGSINVLSSTEIAKPPTVTA
jgi:hypothetical protein